MKVKKKMPYYILGIVAIFVLFLLGPLYHKDGDGSVSVITGILRLPREALRGFAARDVFLAGRTSWMYTLLPVVAAIPSASYIYEELKSRFYMGVQMRKGKYRYVYSGFLYSAVSGGAAVAVGLAVYAAAVCMIFPVNPAGGDAGVEMNTAQFVICMLAKILYLAAYGMAMSAFASFMVYLYQNLYVDLSILFIAAYLLRETAMRENFAFPLFLTGILAVLYGVMWKFRSERI